MWAHQTQQMPIEPWAPGLLGGQMNSVSPFCRWKIRRSWTHCQKHILSEEVKIAGMIADRNSWYSF